MQVVSDEKHITHVSVFWWHKAFSKNCESVMDGHCGRYNCSHCFILVNFNRCYIFNAQSLWKKNLNHKV